MNYAIDKTVAIYSNTEEINFTGVVQDHFGTIAYYENCKYHKDNGPAIIENCRKIIYYSHGLIHRTDGAAIIYKHGFKEYWIDGMHINASSDEEFERYFKLRIFK